MSFEMLSAVRLALGNDRRVCRLVSSWPEKVVRLELGPVIFEVFGLCNMALCVPLHSFLGWKERGCLKMFV